MGSTVRYTPLQLLTTLVLLCSTLSSSQARVENAAGTVETLEDGTIIAKSNARLITTDPGRSRRDAPDEAHSREKRATVVFSSYDKKEIVEKHNSYRAREGSSDMTWMTWDDDLAEQAQAWSDKCVMEHGFDTRAAVNAKFSTLGQNLFMITASTLPDNGYYIRAWYNEISYYTYETKTCQSGKVCGHYTQVVWANTLKVGCGKKSCATLEDKIAHTTYTNAIYVTCNYGPGGNVVGSFPYLKGDPCTACPSGVFWCYDDEICRDCPNDSTADMDDCSCDVDCGCGDKDATACTCSCKAGWTGGRCCSECNDYHANCNSGWYAQNCNSQAYIPGYCPKMCGVCTTTGATCTLAANKRCDSAVTGTTAAPGGGGGGGGGGNSATTQAPTTTQASSQGAATTTVSQSAPQVTTTTTTAATTTTPAQQAPQGSTTTVAPTTTAAQGPTTKTTAAATTTAAQAGPTTTTTSAPTTTAAQEVRDAQANAGVMFELQGSIDQWPIIWSNLQPLLVNAINTACNSPAYYASCCPNSGPQGSSYEAYVSTNTVLVADGYPVTGDTTGTINAVIYAEPIEGNGLCQPASTRRKRNAEGEDNAASLKDILHRVRRQSFTFNFMPQEVLFVAVQEANSNITVTLSVCCNVTVAAVVKSKAEVTTAPPATTEFPAWAIAVVVIGVLVVLAAIVGLVVYMNLKKPNKTVDVDSRYVTRKQIHSTNSSPRSGKTTAQSHCTSPTPDVPIVD